MSPWISLFDYPRSIELTPPNGVYNYCYSIQFLILPAAADRTDDDNGRREKQAQTDDSTASQKGSSRTKRKAMQQGKQGSIHS
ncbi:hypothetical protein R1flu_011460 [Riccia fluitans]|uniref:Uncharacterized protein n=1 Tax=Riccia fluitans TaxID=41844 RepID=A0ABD1Z7V9_9MARC